MARHAVVLICVFVLLGCSKEEPTPGNGTDVVDLGRDMAGDRDDGDSDIGSDASDSSVPIPRTMILETPRMASDNRILMPSFRGTHGDDERPFGSFGATPAVREVFADSPLPEPMLRTSEAADAAVYVLGMATDGEHAAAVWIGRDGDDTATAEMLEATPVAVLGLEIEGAGSEPVASDLSPEPDSLLAANGRSWMRFSGTFTASEGPFLLTLRAPETRLLAPVVKSGVSSVNALRTFRSRPMLSVERELWRKWRHSTAQPRPRPRGNRRR